MDVSQDRVYRLSYTFIEGFCPNLGGFVLGALVKGVCPGGFLGGCPGGFSWGLSGGFPFPIVVRDTNPTSVSISTFVEIAIL